MAGDDELANLELEYGFRARLGPKAGSESKSQPLGKSPEYFVEVAFAPFGGGQILDVVVSGKAAGDGIFITQEWRDQHDVPAGILTCSRKRAGSLRNRYS